MKEVAAWTAPPHPSRLRCGRGIRPASRCPGSREGATPAHVLHVFAQETSLALDQVLLGVVRDEAGSGHVRQELVRGAWPSAWCGRSVRVVHLLHLVATGISGDVLMPRFPIVEGFAAHAATRRPAPAMTVSVGARARSGYMGPERRIFLTHHCPTAQPSTR